jgi:8-oxo-dGTP pyrophosphatase MutT (NUDIX family)
MAPAAVAISSCRSIIEFPLYAGCKNLSPPPPGDKAAASALALNCNAPDNRVMDTALPIFTHDAALRARIADNLAGFAVNRRTDASLKRAAVAVTLATGEDGTTASFLLTRRAPKLRAHAGQWALPGGRLDAGESEVDAALRELHEELGIQARQADVLGHLDDYPTRSGYLISPVVIWLADSTDLSANADEVEAVFRIPLAELERPDSPEIVSIPESDRPIIRVPIHDRHINAPTAAVLYQFRQVGLHGLAERVDGYDQPVFAWR